VGREDLPKEHNGPLAFAELIETLDALVGERVVLQPLEGESSGGGLEVAGTLRRLVGPRGNLFALGESAWVDLNEADFRTASLRTLEGNSFFHITVELKNNTMILGDDGLLGSDRSDPGSAWNSGA
jgi:hypothetical protein